MHAAGLANMGDAESWIFGRKALAEKQKGLPREEVQQALELEPAIGRRIITGLHLTVREEVYRFDALNYTRKRRDEYAFCFNAALQMLQCRISTRQGPAHQVIA